MSQNTSYFHANIHIFYNDSLKTHVAMCSESLYQLDVGTNLLEFVTMLKENTSCVGKLAEEFSSLEFFDFYPNLART